MMNLPINIRSVTLTVTPAKGIMAYGAFRIPWMSERSFIHRIMTVGNCGVIERERINYTVSKDRDDDELTHKHSQCYAYCHPCQGDYGIWSFSNFLGCPSVFDTIVVHRFHSRSSSCTYLILYLLRLSFSSY
jgi:hypothetical protein